MPSRLNNYNVKPPGGYQFKVPETGFIVRSGSMPELMRAIAKYCAFNNLPVPSQEFVEDCICDRLGQATEYHCVDTTTGQPATYPPGKPSCSTLNVSTVIDATKILFRTALQGTVSGAVAEKRAATCVKCEWNQSVAGCQGCSAPMLREAAEKLIGGKTTTRNDDLRTCCLCGCWLRAKVWVPINILKDYTYKEQMDRLKKWAPHCWVATEIENYGNVDVTLPSET